MAVLELVTAGIDTVKVVAYRFEQGAGPAPETRTLARVLERTGEIVGEVEVDAGADAQIANAERVTHVFESSRWKIGPGNVGFDTPAPTVLKACADRRARLGITPGSRGDGGRAGHAPDCGCFGRVWFEVSAPKVFYGSGMSGSRELSNLKLVPPEALYEFAQIASEAAETAAGIAVDPRSWRIARLDVSADFEADALDGRSVIDAVARLKFPRLVPGDYGHGQTAEHRSRHRKFKVYDKALEQGLVGPPRKGDERARYRRGELIRFESQRRFEKVDHPRCWNMRRRVAGAQLHDPLAAVVAKRREVELAGPIAWAQLLATDPARRTLWNHGRYPAGRLLKLAGGAALLAALGREGVLAELGRDRGYALLRELRDTGYLTPSADTTADLEAPVRLVSLAPIVDQIADAFNIAARAA